MARKRNPRRLVLENLRTFNKSLKWMLRGWDVAGTVYGRGDGPRKRTADEYPENQASAWLNLAEWARQLAAAASDLEGYARERAAETSGLDRS